MQHQSISPQLHPKYRSDIDGLRAIAVLSVVAFHAFPEYISGGFIGVDIFFVISGYLISTIIFENLDKGIFSFKDFYSRRIRRIFPALFLVLILSFAFGWFALLTEEYRQLGKHIAGGASFLSNFFLWRESGYFDNTSDTKPLLHLWSLGIEEQFYIVWPILLWLTWKRKANFLKITIFIALISFAVNIFTIYVNPVASFYSPLSRFWELLIGAVLAYIVLYRGDMAIRWSKSRNVISIVGLTLFIGGALFLSKEILFPGWWALLPTLSGAFLIFSGSQAWVNQRILSNRVLVWFGLISFPLYLWHWPLFSFSHIIQGEVSAQLRLALIASSIGLAWVTYKIVEQPIRIGKKGNLKTASLITLIIIVGYIGYNTYQRGGLSFRKNAELKSYSGDIGHLEFHKYIAQNFYPCSPQKIAEQSFNWAGFTRCAQSQESSNIQIAMIGDSEVEHLFIGMAESLPRKNITFYIKASPPYIDNKEFSNIFEYVLKSKSIKTVILGMYWPDRLGVFLPKGSSEEVELLRTAQLFINSGKDVFIVNNVPTFPFDPDKCRGKRWLSTNETQCTMSQEMNKVQLNQYMKIVQNIAKADPRIKLIDINRYLCNESECSQVKGDALLYRDRLHLNINGSKIVGQEIVIDNQVLNK